MWALFFVLVLLIPLLAVVLDSQLGRALARRIEGRGGENTRVSRLEAEVDRLGRELERLQEQSDFMTRLLDERDAGALPGPAPPDVPESTDLAELDVEPPAADEAAGGDADEDEDRG